MKKITALFLAFTLALAFFAFPTQSVYAQESAQTSNAPDEAEKNDETEDKSEDESVNPFTLINTTNLKGEAFDAEILLNKPVIINVWADWCGPCRMEMPVLTKLAEEYKDQIVFLGLLAEGAKFDEEGLKKDPEKIESGLNAQEELNIGFETLIPDELLFSAMYQTQLQAFPTTWFINEKGQIAGITQGAMSEEQWREQIETFLSFLKENPAD